MSKNLLLNSIKNSLHLYKFFERVIKASKYYLNKKKILNIVDIILTLLVLESPKINEIFKNGQIPKKSLIRRLRIINSILPNKAKNITSINYFSTRTQQKIKFYVSNDVVNLLNYANRLKTEYKNRNLRSSHIFLALLKEKNKHFKKIFYPYILNFGEFEKDIQNALKDDLFKANKPNFSKKKVNLASHKSSNPPLFYSLKQYIYFFLNLVAICKPTSITDEEILFIKNFFEVIHKKIDVNVKLDNSLFNLLNAFTYFTNKKNIIKLDSYYKNIEVIKSTIPINQHINPFKLKYNISWFNNRGLDKFDFFDYGLDTYYNQVFKILLKSSTKNVILVGEDGIGKSTFLKKLAKSFLNKKSFIPSVFHDKLILFLNSSFLVSQTSSLDELIEPFNKLIEISKKEPNLFIFIDDIELYCKTDRDGTINLSLLEPFISSNIKCIVTTNEEAYNSCFKSNNIFNAKFEKIIFHEPNIEKTKNILDFLKPKFEKRYKLKISKEVIEKICFYSKEYLVETKFPKNAVNLLNNACLETSLIKSKINLLSIKLRQQIELFFIKRTNLDLLKDSLELTLIEEKINVYRSLLKLIILSQIRKDFLYAKIRKTLNESDLLKSLLKFNVTDIAKIFATMNIDILNLQQELQKKVIGQEHAIKSIIGGIKRYKIGLKSSNKPIGSFFFAGPTGVGKTEFAKALAKLFYNNENALLRLDMSEYTHKSNVSALIGSPPGYIGFDKGGKLTEFVKINPYSLILFDEMEKADPAIYDILLQVLDEGRLTDSRGNTVNFSKTFIIFTSNIGVHEIDIYCTNDQGQPTDVIKPNLNRSLVRFAESKTQVLWQIIPKNIIIDDFSFTKINANNLKLEINHNVSISSKNFINDAIKFITESKLTTINLIKKIKFPTFNEIINTFNYLLNSKKHQKNFRILKDLEIKNYFEIYIYLGGKRTIEKSQFSKTISSEICKFPNLENYYIKNTLGKFENTQTNIKELCNFLRNIKYNIKNAQIKTYPNLFILPQEFKLYEEEPLNTKLNTQDKNLLKIVKGCLFQKFRPEFINRIDDIIVFQRLNLRELKIITLKLLLDFMKNFYSEYKIKLFIDEKFINLISEIGYNPKYGARPLKRALNEFLSDRLVSFLLNRNLENVSQLYISIDDDKDFVCYITKKFNNQNEFTRIQNCQLEFVSESLNISKANASKYLNAKFTNFINLPY